MKAAGATRDLIEEGRYEEAVRSARTHLAAVEAAGGRDSLAAAGALDQLVEALWRSGKAWHPGTLEAAERAVALKKGALGARSEPFADSLLQQARVLDESAAFAEARGLYERVLGIYRSVLAPADPKIAVASLYLGTLLRELGHLTAARAHLERSLEVFQGALGPEHPWTAEALCQSAWLARDARDLDTARSLFERSLLAREAALGKEHPAVADSLDGLTLLYWELSEFEAARRTGRRAVAVREKALRPGHPSLPRSYVNLYLAEAYAGGVPESSRHVETALRLAEASLPPRHPELALVLDHYGDISDERTFVRGLQAYERALAIYETAYGPAHWRVAWVLTDLWLALVQLGDPERVIEVMERAVAIWEASEVGGRHAGSLNRLAVGLRESGRYEEAQQVLERALAVARSEKLPLTWLANLYQSLARNLWSLGDSTAAVGYAELALATRERAMGPRHAHLMDELFLLSELRAAAGEHDSAMALCERSLDLIEGDVGAGHFFLQWCLHQKALLLLLAGDGDGALEMGMRLEEIVREYVQTSAQGLPERFALGLLSGQKRGLDVVLSVAAADARPAVAAAAMSAVSQARGLVLDVMARRHAEAKSKGDPELARLDRALTAARATLARLAVRGPAEGARGSARERLEEAQREKERAERRLAARSNSSSGPRARVATGFREVAGALPAKSALVAYVRYDRLDLRSTAEGPEWPPAANAAYLAFVLRSGQTKTEAVNLGSAQELEARVAAVREQIWRVAEAPGRSTKRSELTYRLAAEGLRELIWDPLRPFLEGVERIFVVPDGALNLINLDALPAEGSGYLLEQPPLIHYLSAERDLVTAVAERPEGHGLLAVGDPAYDEARLFAALASPADEPFRLAQAGSERGRTAFRGRRAACGGFSSMRFEDLPASAEELVEVETVWRRRDEPRDSDPILLTGAAASEAAFKRMSGGKAVLHVAAHGFFLGGRCRGVPSSGPVGSPAEENPLLLSGLALAGANHRLAAGPDEEDGILTAEEIAALDLQGVEWAVLSACETGLGEVRAGEGVFGLRRAFQIAGARTLIMSLWPVEDGASRDWMKALYEHRLLGELDTAESVRQASLDLLHRRRDAGSSTHPFYWGGFVAVGDWR